MHTQNLKCSTVLHTSHGEVVYFVEAPESVSWKDLLSMWRWLGAMLIIHGDPQWTISCSDHLYSNLLI